MIDANGLVVQEDGDGGDCPARCGVVLGYLPNTMSIQSRSSQELVLATQRNLMLTKDVYFRYPIKYNQTNDFSRDQASRLMLGYGIVGAIVPVKGYYKLLVKNWMRHQNNDLLGLGEPGNIIRSLSLWYLYPLLLAFDIKFLWDVTLGVKLQPWDYQNLYLMDLYYANKKYKTVWSWLASKLIDKTLAASQIYNNLKDPKNNGCSEAYDANMFFLNNL